jgi:hypothetical protein
MNTCDRCEHWGRYDVYGKCCEVPSYKKCEHPLVDNNRHPDGFGAYDGEPYNGGSFASGPKFGCIHWTPRKP